MPSDSGSIVGPSASCGPHVVMGPRTQSVRFGVMPWVQFWAVNCTAAAPWFQPVVPETAVQSLQALAKKAGCLLVAVHALGSLVGNLPQLGRFGLL